MRTGGGVSSTRRSCDARRRDAAGHHACAGRGRPLETPDIHGAYPRLSEEQTARLAEQGRRRAVGPGDVLIREGERCETFYVILSGAVAVVEGTARPTSICSGCTAPAASSASSACRADRWPSTPPWSGIPAKSSSCPWTSCVTW
ncbi:hypothetical protein ACFQV4_18065 [Streptomyces thermocarboxydus]